MYPSDFPFTDVLICPWCQLRQDSGTGLCRRCRRPLFSYLELRIPPAIAKSNWPDAVWPRGLIGKTLRRLRFRRGCTQSSLASAIGTHRMHLSRIEKGRSVPALALLLRAAAALSVVRILLCVSARVRPTRRHIPAGAVMDKKSPLFRTVRGRSASTKFASHQLLDSCLALSWPCGPRSWCALTPIPTC